MEVAGIYEQFHQSLLSYIRSKVRSKEDAEDILQNVFVKISSNVSKLQEHEKLKSWIYTITRNAIIDYYRANSNNKRIAITEDFEKTLPETESLDATGGLDQCVNSMVSLLPEEYRNIIIDSEIAGIRQKELAEKYNMAYPSLRSRVQRGRERLKKLFLDCCHIEADRHGNILDARGRGDCGDNCQPSCT